MKSKLILALLSIVSFTSKAQIDTSMWYPNGNVGSFCTANNTLYMAGNFEYVGPQTGSVVPIMESTETILNGYNQVFGTVYRVIEDGQGGWFIGGEFYIKGIPGIEDIAHILPDFKVDTNFIADTNKEVWDMKLSGNKLYVGGNFTRVNGTVRVGIAALEGSTGNLLAWNCNVDTVSGNGDVYSLALYGPYLYAGGAFAKVGGVNRVNLVELDTASASVTAWAPAINGIIRCLKVYGSDLYFSGSFSTVNSQTRRYISKFSLPAHSLGILSVSLGSGSNGIDHFELVNNNIYICGGFITVMSNSRGGVARVSLTGVLDLNWNPPTYGSINGFSHIVKYRNGKIYTNVRLLNEFVGVTELDTTNGTPIPHSIKVQYGFTDFAGSGDTILLAGKTNIIGTANGPGVLRKNIAAFNTVTKQINGFNPLINSSFVFTSVSSMLLVNGKLVVGGGYTNINGLSRTYLAAVDPVSGLLDSWNPSVNAPVRHLVKNENLLYVTGNFDTIAGIPQRGIATFDTLTLNPVTCPINIHNSVSTAEMVSNLEFYNNLIFFSGSFDTIAGQRRKNIACFDKVAGTITAFDANVPTGGIIFGSHIYNDRLFVYGGFSSIGDSVRSQIAELNITTGKSTAWNHGLNTVPGGGVYDVVSVDDSLLLGGSIRIYPAPYYDEPMVIMDPITGGIRNWNDAMTVSYSSGYWNLTNAILKIHTHANKLYAGGQANILGNTLIANMATYTINPQPHLNYKALRGNIYGDQNLNCIRDSAELSLANMIVELQPGSQYAGTDAAGDYVFFVEDTGSYVISQVPRAPLFNIEQSCPALPGTLSATVTATTPTIYNLNFGDSLSTTNCHLLYLDISSARRRVCRTSKTYAFIKNEGIGSAPNAELRLIYPPYLQALSSIPAWTSKQDSLIIYSLGNLNAGESRYIILTDSVTCVTNVTGLTACVNGELSPANNCSVPLVQYDGSDIELNAQCLGSNVIVTLQNNGNGNMNDSSTVRVFFDSLFVYENKFILDISENINVTIPANGQTIRLEAEQAPFHPDFQMASVTIEGCNGTGPVNTGFINQYNDDDDNPETAVSCLPLVNSLDPNEKQALPEGVGAQHLILPETEIEYTIHFQNTGNDVAYDIFISDTLDSNLDIGTFYEGSSSHPYTWSISGNIQPVLRFDFNRINLPDSGSNYENSQGFVNFSIRPKSTAGPGTLIRNKAGIYFDFNSPVITNEWQHLIASAFPADFSLGNGITITTGMDEAANELQMSIVPNPSGGCITVNLQTQVKHSTLLLEITNIYGTVLRRENLNSNSNEICLTDLTHGLYFARVKSNNEVIANSKLIIIR